MVTNVTSLTGNGLRDWLIQRVSALVIGAYALFMIIFLLCNPHLQYTDWVNLYSCIWVKVATVLGLVAFLFHAWIGIWTVTTDYLKAKAFRITIQIIVFLFLLSQLIWGLMIIWGQS